jgi:hypothetical protein
MGLSENAKRLTDRLHTVDIENTTMRNFLTLTLAHLLGTLSLVSCNSTRMAAKPSTVSIAHSGSTLVSSDARDTTRIREEVELPQSEVASFGPRTGQRGHARQGGFHGATEILIGDSFVRQNGTTFFLDPPPRSQRSQAEMLPFDHGRVVNVNKSDLLRLYGPPDAVSQGGKKWIYWVHGYP